MQIAYFRVAKCLDNTNTPGLPLAIFSSSPFSNSNLLQNHINMQCGDCSACLVSKEGPRAMTSLHNTEMLPNARELHPFSWLLLHPDLRLGESSLCVNGKQIKHNCVVIQTSLGLTGLFSYILQTQGYI